MDANSGSLEYIIGKPPSWYLRWGITSIFLFTIIVITTCGFIKYPDYVLAKIIITTKSPPINLVTRSGGRIRFFIKDNQKVDANQLLAYIDNAAKVEDVLILKKQLSLLQNSIFKPHKISYLNDALQVGDLQNGYLQLLNSIKIYDNDSDKMMTNKYLSSLKERVDHYKELNLKLEIQKKIQFDEFNLTTKKLNTDEYLYKQKVIAEVDLDKSKISVLQIKRQYESSENLMINNKIIISELESQIFERFSKFSKEQETKWRDIYTSFKQLQSQLIIWEKQYFILAPIKGKASILEFLSDNQYINSSTEIIIILPFSNNIYGQAIIQSSGSGKVEIGQEVRIKLDYYPYNEYGVVKGSVVDISPIPRNNSYLIKVSLAKGLNTNFNKRLPFKQQLSGTAEIITKKMSILQRIFIKINSLISQAFY